MLYHGALALTSVLGIGKSSITRCARVVHETVAPVLRSTAPHETTRFARKSSIGVDSTEIPRVALRACRLPTSGTCDCRRAANHHRAAVAISPVSIEPIGTGAREASVSIGALAAYRSTVMRSRYAFINVPAGAIVAVNISHVA